jgi:hypothetical protein
MPLAFWAAQTMAALDLLGVVAPWPRDYSSHTLANYSPYAAAISIQAAYLTRYYRRYNAANTIQVAYLKRYFWWSVAACTIQVAWFECVSYPLDNG